MLRDGEDVSGAEAKGAMQSQTKTRLQRTGLQDGEKTRVQSESFRHEEDDDHLSWSWSSTLTQPFLDPVNLSVKIRERYEAQDILTTSRGLKLCDQSARF